MGDEQQLSAAQARLALANDARARVKACSDEIFQVCERHGCRLVAVPMLTPDGRVVAQVQVTDKGPAS